jgi:hypothetical protein
VFAAQFDVDRCRVAADAGIGFENMHIVVSMQIVSACQPGDSAANHGNFHEKSSC